MTAPDGLVIRAIETTDELRACEDLQKEVWGYSEREVVPKNELVAAARSGGSLLGAFDGAALVAFAYGMAGFDGARPYLSSRLVAVREAFRGHGLGERLKLAQREDARKKGYERIRWTQDALQAANARLNFRKLGATARSYRRDYYGSTSSPLHGSLPTDRLEVDWELDAPRVRRRLGEEKGVSPASVPASAEAASLLDASADALPRPVVVSCVARGSSIERAGPREPAAGAERLTVAIPPSFAACLEQDPALALAWRLATRAAFERAFAAGFAVVDFASSRPGDPGAFARYVLERTTS